jgi:hypothetical protein
MEEKRKRAQANPGGLGVISISGTVESIWMPLAFTAIMEEQTIVLTLWFLGLKNSASSQSCSVSVPFSLMFEFAALWNSIEGAKSSDFSSVQFISRGHIPVSLKPDMQFSLDAPFTQPL